jgi:hypothetical protein
MFKGYPAGNFMFPAVFELDGCSQVLERELGHGIDSRYGQRQSIGSRGAISRTSTIQVVTSLGRSHNRIESLRREEAM